MTGTRPTRVGVPFPAGAATTSAAPAAGQREAARSLAARTDHAYVVIGTVPVGGGHLTCGAPETGRLTADEPT
ncbi:hypothetical protein ACFVAO_31620, partial [Streptomyces californicus]